MKTAGVDFVVSVPEFNFVDLLRVVDEDPAFTHVPVCREEEGVGVCAGAWLGGRRPILAMQNAGFLNSCNALVTTGLQFEIPLLMLVWHAGALGDSAFMRLGEVTEGVIRGLGLRFVKPRHRDEIPRALTEARRAAEAGKRPVTVLLDRHSLEELP
jgi:sulfopyruvate decarboxylase subunit alpha